MKKIADILLRSALAVMILAGLQVPVFASAGTFSVEDSLSSMAPEPVSTQQAIAEMLPRGWPENGIHVFPEAGRAPWEEAIMSATESIQMCAYKFSDPALVDLLIKTARERHIKIDLLIQPETYAHEKSLNVASPIKRLKESGVTLHTLSDRFGQSHHKMILVDGKWALVSSGNLDAESFDGVKTLGEAPCRDFAITLTNPAMIADLSKVFTADISDKRLSPSHNQLVWGPDTQRSVFLKMINAAKKSIRIYQQDFQDVGLAQAVAGAARDGVAVEVIMMPFPFSKTDDMNIPNQTLIQRAGGKVTLHKALYIHAKLMIIDGDDSDNRLMYIGSCNFYPSSLDQNRELGVLTSDPSQIAFINKIFDQDRLKT